MMKNPKLTDKKSAKTPYEAKTIEASWQSKWQETGIYQPDLDNAKKPFYNLMMFPYPSAEGLHVGSFFTYGGIDAYGRFKKLQGYSVFEPIGLDGFGIHSENYAIKVGRTPQEHAEISEKNFYRQLHSLGNMFDWSRTLETYDPDYYRWTQWLFIELFKAGLAYKAKAKVNFCPSCKTVLADEQVITKIKNQKSKIKDISVDPHESVPEAGKTEVSVKVCERCGTEIEMRNLAQWFFRITDYSERLLENLKTLDWSEKVKVAQKNWIGKSTGAKIEFRIKNLEYSIQVFTTRPDTLFGATFMVIAPEHPLAQKLLDEKSQFSIQSSQLDEIREYVKQAKEKSDTERTEEKERTGVFSGLYAVNPISGEELPVWISDYVLMGYGTGAIMAVPAHDERDFEFAKKYNLSIKQVIEPQNTAASDPASFFKDARQKENKEGPASSSLSEGLSPELLSKKENTPKQTFSASQNEQDQSLGIQEAYTGNGVLINSGDWDGWEMPREMEKVFAWLRQKGIGEETSNYHLRDWLISRQRYWGAPIPMIYCEVCAKEGKSWFDTEEARSRFRIKDLGLKNEKEKNHQSEAMAGWYPEETLPVLLPEVKNFEPLGTGKAPLANYPEFYETTCPECGGPATRETDVCDTFLDSSWYFLRYLATDWQDMPFPSVKYAEDLNGRGHDKSYSDPASFLKDARQQEEKVSSASSSLSEGLSPELLSKKENTPKQTFSASQNEQDPSVENFKLKIENSANRSAWLPVTSYIGGAEHSVLHLLYSRFVTMVLHDLGYLDFEEPFTKFRHNGLIIKDGAKMSKSRGNVINPDEYVNKYGADTLRMYLAFVGPFSDGGDFRDTGIEGMNRFLKRVWTLLVDRTLSGSEPTDSAQRLLHRTIAGVTADMEELRFNTAIAKLMTYYNGLSKQTEITTSEAKAFVQMLAPFAPHMAEELWARLGEAYSVHTSTWPAFDEQYLVQDFLEIAVQINGKTREIIQMQRAESEEQREVEKQARSIEKVQKYLSGATVKKVIYVPGKIINFVVS